LKNYTWLKKNAGNLYVTFKIQIFMFLKLIMIIKNKLLLQLVTAKHCLL